MFIICKNQQLHRKGTSHTFLKTKWRKTSVHRYDRKHSLKICLIFVFLHAHSDLTFLSICV